MTIKPLSHVSLEQDPENASQLCRLFCGGIWGSTEGTRVMRALDASGIKYNVYFVTDDETHLVPRRLVVEGENKQKFVDAGGVVAATGTLMEPELKAALERGGSGLTQRR